jgi:hypothetical protein
MTLEEIDAADWPAIVKEKAKQVLAARSNLNETLLQTRQTKMMSGEKASELARIANAHQHLARLYRELSKELVYSLAHPRAEITRGNLR